MSIILHYRNQSRKGFSLVEVVLAIGIFLVTILALVGLLGPTLKTVDEVEKTDEVSSVVSSINSFLHNSPNIAPGGSRFNAIYDAVAQDHATLLIFRAYGANDLVSLKIGFVGETDQSAQISEDDVSDGTSMFAAGPVYRAILTPSSANPEDTRTDNGEDEFPRYTMDESNPDDYEEGYFAIEVRIFAEEPSLTFDDSIALDELILEDPIFTYNTAIIR